MPIEAIFWLGLPDTSTPAMCGCGRGTRRSIQAGNEHARADHRSTSNRFPHCPFILAPPLNQRTASLQELIGPAREIGGRACIPTLDLPYVRAVVAEPLGQRLAGQTGNVPPVLQFRHEGGDQFSSSVRRSASHQLSPHRLRLNQDGPPFAVLSHRTLVVASLL